MDQTFPTWVFGRHLHQPQQMSARVTLSSIISHIQGFRGYIIYFALQGIKDHHFDTPMT